MSSISLIQYEDDAGVYDLISKLCNKLSSKYNNQNLTSQKKLFTRMRSRSFELLLKKSEAKIPTIKSTEISDLLSYYFILQQNIKNVIDFKRSLKLRKIINNLRKSKFGNNKETLQVLKILILLKDLVSIDSSDIFKAPFEFGILDEILPRLEREEYGSVKPYQYYPSYIFEFPFSLNGQVCILNGEKSQTYPNYALEVFESKSCLPTLNNFDPRGNSDKKSVMTPSIESWSVPGKFTYSEGNFLNLPRLTAPRDLQLPPSETNKYCSKVPPVLNTSHEIGMKEDSKHFSRDIWDIASQIDKDVPHDIWETVAKMQHVHERQLIASNTREVGLWRFAYNQVMTDLCVISEKVFIRHLMYLIIGIETSSFIYCSESHCFYMRQNLCLEGMSKECIGGYVSGLLLTGTYFKRLYNFAFNQALDDHFHENGLIYEAAREVVRRFLIKFRLHSTKIFEESYKHISDDVTCMPTLLEILYHIEPMQYEMETIASIFKMTGPDPKTAIPCGAELMSYLFNEISLTTNSAASNTLFGSLFSVCKVYFKFIERFIFEGELDDKYHEFFIRKDLQYVNSHSKKYWDKGFHISQSVTVPEFLKVLAKCILLCGKSLRLLKLCNPSDPLVVLISTNHPSVKCCWNLEELERQQQILDVYRTRCLFVSGEPAIFQQILLKRDAEKKAFTEMASQKQAETMEKIMAERKRLAQLIIAEKQHSLRVLEAAIAETKAAKNKSKRRERLKTEFELEAEKAREEVDSKLKDDERNKMLAYYSKLNKEVERSKIHTEWKIKRLQLDEARMQLLSSEERNLKREKLELEHQQNEVNIPESVTSQNTDAAKNLGPATISCNEKSSVIATVSPLEKSDCIKNCPDVFHESCSDQVHDIITNKMPTKSDIKKRNSSEVFNLIYNAAKNIFGFKSDENNDVTKCDNINQFDAQGNVLDSTEINSNVNQENTTEELLKRGEGEKKNIYSDFDVTRREALVNKEKGMSHSVILTDIENNETKCSVADAENNLPLNNRTINKMGEAERNKIKVLGTELGNFSNISQKTVYEPCTEAQKEALLNKKKVLGVEYNLPQKYVNLKVPANQAQEEALENKQKIMGVEYNKPPDIVLKKNPISEEQEKALLNKQKIMGVDYGQDLDIIKQQPANEAQEEALRNRKKILDSDLNFVHYETIKQIPAKRAGLTLDLKSVADSHITRSQFLITPNTGAVTPAEFFPRLDLETPTTAEAPFDGQIASDPFSPNTNENKDQDTTRSQSDEDYLSPKGFNFSTLIPDEEDVESGDNFDLQMNTSTESSPTKTFLNPSAMKDSLTMRALWNTKDDYDFEDFDPFGIRELRHYSNDYFNKKMDSNTNKSCYTHPAILMQELQKSPHDNMFATYFTSKDDDDPKVTCDNIAILTACLQRSVMLPLSYQLEVVNNSILTHFLVDLDMYEHLKSLKDYFFLMDGEFSSTICHNLFTKLNKTVNPQELLNFATLHRILNKSLGSSITRVNKLSENLSFTISEPPLSFHHSSPDVLQCLSLTYEIGWPLNIILSQEALIRYSKVFQFLIKMRRISWVLGQDFEELKFAIKLSKHPRKLQRSPQYICLQIYRHTMASLVRALDNYIVTTCILTSWTEFEEDLKKARTLDDLYDCHVVYVKKVLFRCLLNNRSTPVMKLLNDIFTVVLKFSRVLRATPWQYKDNSGTFIHSNFAQLEELFHLFEKLAKYLHKVVTRLMECGYQRHLAELLSMVNLNNYYEPDKSKSKEHSSSLQLA